MSDVYFDERMETLPPDVLLKLQDHRLRWQFRRCWDGSPFYRARFEAAGLSPETFGGLTDLERLPPLSDEEVGAAQPEDVRVVPESLVEWTGSYGDLRRSETRSDCTHRFDRTARAAWAVGRTKGNDLRLRFHDDTGKPQTAARRYLPPDYGELRRWPNRNLSHQVVGSDLGIQCLQRDGHHWIGDQLLAEILDVATLKAAPDCLPGELVVTDLVREASPLIRYRTGLIVVAGDEPCPCGRTGLRLWSRSAYKRRRR